MMAQLLWPMLIQVRLFELAIHAAFTFVKKGRARKVAIDGHVLQLPCDLQFAVPYK